MDDYFDEEIEENIEREEIGAADAYQQSSSIPEQVSIEPPV